MKLFIVLVYVLSFIQLAVSDTQIYAHPMDQALKLLGNEETKSCIMILQENIESSSRISFDKDSMTAPIMAMTIQSLDAKGTKLSMCQNIIALVDDGGTWLTLLPVEHKTIFISHNLDFVEDYPRLSRLRSSLYFLASKTSAMTIHFEIYSRPQFDEGPLTKMTLQGAQEVMYMDHALIQTNFAGVNMYAVAFSFLPFSLVNFETGQYGGYEYNIASALADSLDLDMVVRPPTTGAMWGREEADGNFTGLQGDLQYGVADIGWGNLFVTSDRMRIMEFTNWYLHDPTCFAYKRPSPYAGILSLVFPLENETWFFIGILLIVVNLFYLLYTAVWRDEKLTFSDLVMYEASVAFKESHHITFRFNTTTIRLFTAIFLLGMLVITASYSGTLISFFTIEKYPSPPQTFDDLAKLVIDNDMKVRPCCLHITDAMEQSKRESFEIMTQPERFSQSYSGDAAGDFKKIYYDNFVYVYAKNALEILRRRLSDEIPYDEVRIMGDCFLPNRIAFGVSNNNPFRAALNVKLQMLKEAGLVNKIIQDSLDDLARVQEDAQEVSFVMHELNLEEMQGIFQVWGFFVALGGLVFCGELLRGRYLLKKKSKRDKPPKVVLTKK